MPKLNRIRFTHLEYNNGRSVITDQILNIEGVSTLLKMENGGGKSVMTQMLLAPYISGKKRNFPSAALRITFAVNCRPSFFRNGRRTARPGTSPSV